MARSGKSGSRPPSSGILLFVVGFLGCLLLCAAAGYVWWRVTDPQIPWLNLAEPSAPTTPAPPENTSLYQPADRFTHAVYITDESDALQSLSLITVCPDTQSVAVAAIPVELHLSDTSETDTLLRRFRMEGVAAANEALSAVFPSAPHYYTVLSYTQIEGYFNALSAKLNVRLPKDVDEAAEDASYSVHLTAGDHALSPHQITNLMRCKNWQCGRRERADIHALLVQSYIDQFISEQRTVTADYKQLIAHSETNLSEAHFSSLSPVWEYLAISQPDGSPALLPSAGLYEGATTTLRFTLTTELSDRIASYWRPDPVDSNTP